jgi:hypothetical protein
MPPEVAPISPAADKAHGSAVALKTVASLTRVAKQLTGVVDLAATFGKAMFDIGTKAKERVDNQLTVVADAWAELLNGGDTGEPAIGGVG